MTVLPRPGRAPASALSCLIGLILTAAPVLAQDLTPPTAPGTPNEGSASVDVDYDGDGKYKVAWAKAADPQSKIAAYELQEQAVAGGPWTTLTNSLTGRSFAVTGRPDGARLFYRVRAKNGAGLWGPFSGSSDGVLVDRTPPSNIGSVADDGLSTSIHDSFHFSWAPASDPQSGIRDYQARLREKPGATIVNWTSVGAGTDTTLSGLSLQTGKTYVVDIRATNSAGLKSKTTTSDGINVVDSSGVPTQPSQISLNGRRLMLSRRNPDGTLAAATPFVIKAVNWSPADRQTATSPSDIDNVVKRRPEFGQHYLTDIPLLKAMNVNTVRLFMDPGLPGDPNLVAPGLEVLDELYRNGIMVIMTVDNGNNTVERIQPVVAHYKNHPAVLMWSLASEFNLNRFWKPQQFPTVESAAQAVESAAQLVKAVDTGHPVAASYGSIYDKPNDIEHYVQDVCPTIDIWSFNEYRGPGFTRLFDQWRFISGKPMFLGEYGIDAYNTVLDAEDQASHAAYVGQLWDEIVRNLSAANPNEAALGGAVMAWQDEWWKDGAYSTQDVGGWEPLGFPDHYASEDYWGIVTIDRVPRQLYSVLAAKFAPGYVPPAAPTSIIYRAESVASIFARFFESEAPSYSGRGASIDGGRGFNIAAIDRSTGRLIAAIQRFDTWGTRHTGVEMNKMNAFIDSVPQGTLLLIAVGDEAGLNHFPGDPQGRCGVLPYAWVSTALSTLQSLGATLAPGICYQDQWSLIAIKGQGIALDEALGAGSADAVAEATVVVQ